MKKLKNIALLLVIFVLFLSTAAQVHAFSSFYFSPQRKNIEIGQTQEVELRINTDTEQINALSAYISYPSDKIKVSLVSTSSRFPVIAENSVEDGNIAISLGSFDHIQGDILVAKFKITGKREGSATLSFESDSAAPRFSDSSDSLSLSRSTAGFYTISRKSNQGEKDRQSMWSRFLRLQEEFRRRFF